MSLQSNEAVYVKTEPDWESDYLCGVGEAAARVQGDWLKIEHEFKDEQDWENESDACGVSEVAAREGLYKDHQVKDELVLGPELLQPPDVVFALQASLSPVEKETWAQETLGRACSVSLEHMFVDTEHQTCRVGFQTYKLRLCPQGLQPLVQHENETNATKSMCRKKMRHQDQRIHEKTNKSELYVRDGLKKGNMAAAEEQEASAVSQGCSETDAAVGELAVVKHITTSKTKEMSGDKSNNTGSRAFESKLMLLQHKRTLQDQKRSLLGHERKHTGEKSHKCTHCSYASTKRSNLLRHERIHTGEKPYKCISCRFASASRINLVTHVRIHTGDKPYKCIYCNFAGAQRNQLLIHERIHTGEKPHKCSDCSYASTNRSALLRHERMHTGEKLYKCTHCSYASIDRSDLLKHERMHTGEKPHKCTHCSYASTNRSALLRHKRIHTGEKPHKCTHCSYASTHKSALLRHKRIHTGEKPHKCTNCSYASTHKSSLLRHKRIHTGEELYKCTH